MVAKGKVKDGATKDGVEVKARIMITVLTMASKETTEATETMITVNIPDMAITITTITTSSKVGATTTKEDMVHRIMEMVC